MKKSALQNPPFFWIAFVFFIFLAIAVRIHDFGTYPADINCDEAMAAVEAMAIMENGADQFGTSYPVYFETWGHGQMNALLIYILAVVIKFFGASTTMIRLPMLLLSLAGIAAITWIAWMVFSKEAALFVLAFASINPWHIMASRWTLESNLFPHLLVIGHAFLIYTLESRKMLFFYLAMLLYGISLYAYGVSFTFMPFFLAGIYILFLRNRTFKISALLGGCLTFLAVAWPLILMMAINYFQLPSLRIGPMTIQYFDKSIRTGSLLFSAENIFQQLGKNFLSFVNLILLQKMDLWWNQLPTVGTMYKITTPLIVWGVIYLTIRLGKDNPEQKSTVQHVGIQILMISLFTSFISAMLIIDINVNRVNSIFYPLIIFGAIGIFSIFQKKQFWGIVLAGVYGVYFLFFCYRYFYSDDRFYLNYTFDKGFTKAISQTVQYPSQPVCISTNLYRPDEKIVSVYLKYNLQLPYRYYANLMTAEELKSGQYYLPYTEKYTIFDDLEATYSTKADQCIYIINVRDRDFFDRTRFDVDSNDFFSIAIPKSIYVTE